MKNKNNDITRSSAFSLVELSIVLVILGLLTGGILGGQSLIKAAELRSVTTDVEAWTTAVNTFKQKYFALPGDITNATSFWGNADTGTMGGECADPDLDSGSGTQTCNGDGNGKVGEWVDSSGNSTAGALFHENFRLWQHLANAGLVTGTFTGTEGSGGNYHCVIGENVPASKYNGGGWNVANAAYFAGDSLWPEGDYGNYFQIGAEQAGDNTLWDSLFTTEEAWNIDMKMDDGKPGTGHVILGKWDDCTGGEVPTNMDADYALDVEGSLCSLMFTHAF